MTCDVQTVRPDEVRAVEPELSGLRVHHRHERLAVAVTDVIGERNSRIVGALDQRRLDEVADRMSLTGSEVHGRLADRGCVCPDAHDVPPSACSSVTRTVISFVMLAIGTRAQAPRCASTSPVAGFSTMNARAETGGGDAPRCAAVTKASAARTAATQIRRITSGKASVGRRAHLTRMRCPMCIAVGSMPGFRVISSSTVVLYFPAMEPSVSPLRTT